MSVTAEMVCFEDEKMWVTLSAGRVIGVPVVWFLRLLQATGAEREGFTLSLFGIRWEAPDEDVSIEGLLAGRGISSGSGGEAA